jgi:hypothetical protein
MIDSYWDLYIAYVSKCVRDNWANDIDPHHYKMEWNHFLPKCVFDDWPIGQYLTLKQHAIASALQTLALQKNCMFGWHKTHLPDFLLNLAWPYYSEMCAKTGRKHGSKRAASNFTSELCSENGKKYGKINGMKTAATNFLPHCSANGKKRGKRIMLTKIATGETFKFPSAQEAARVLGLNRGHISNVARGVRKHHEGYIAVYLPDSLLY